MNQTTFSWLFIGMCLATTIDSIFGIGMTEAPRRYKSILSLVFGVLLIVGIFTYGSGWLMWVLGLTYVYITALIATGLGVSFIHRRYGYARFGEEITVRRGLLTSAISLAMGALVLVVWL